MKISWKPEYAKIARSPLLDNVKLKVLSLATSKDIEDYFKSVLTSNTSISASDMDNLLKFLVETQFVIDVNIPHKEILVSVVSTYLNEGMSELIKIKFNSSTDVLRLAVALSNGDVSLAKNTKFINFSRKMRRFLLNRLDNIENKFLSEEMMEKAPIWIRLGEKLHVGEYKKAYPNAAKAFHEVRNSQVKTFNSKFQNAELTQDVVDVLKIKPGVFARNLDNILRKYEGTEIILDAFKSKANKVSTPVLLQLFTHFTGRNSYDNRVVFPKGSVAKLKVIPGTNEQLDTKISNSVVKITHDELVSRFSKLDPWKTVYIDPAIEKFIVPFSERSASEQLKSVVRGSRIPMNSDKEIVRFFIYWHEKGSRADIDLSATMYDEDFNLVSDVAYYNLREGGFGFHSGDITSAPNGASEFIDINYNKLLKEYPRAKYLMMNINSFNNVKFSDMQEVSAGFMMRDHVNSGEIYEPKTVEYKFSVKTEANNSVPLIIDIENKEVIWCDITFKNGNGYSDVRNSLTNLKNIANAFVNLKKTTFADLILLHAEARNAKIVTDKNKAEVVFSLDSGFTPYDIAKISSELLA